MNIPPGVTDCLYTGIITKIEVMDCEHHHYNQSLIDHGINEIAEALSYFAAYCEAPTALTVLEKRYGSLIASLSVCGKWVRAELSTVKEVTTIGIDKTE